MIESQFRWVFVAFGLIPGIGITRLLSALVAAIRSRTATSPDLLALIWVACIFIA
jgi:hypothetical protein